MPNVVSYMRDNVCRKMKPIRSVKQSFIRGGFLILVVFIAKFKLTCQNWTIMFSSFIFPYIRWPYLTLIFGNNCDCNFACIVWYTCIVLFFFISFFLPSSLPFFLTFILSFFMALSKIFHDIELVKENREETHGWPQTATTKDQSASRTLSGETVIQKTSQLS